jgi:hypothetical protein
MKSGAEPGGASEEGEGDFSEHRRTLHCFVALARFTPDELNSKTHRFGKQNRRFDSPHHQTGAVVSGSLYFQ